MTKADLHFHSYYSDGLYSPSVLAQKAKEAKIKVVSLTDHDSVSGIAEMSLTCKELGLQLITGIEFSTFMLTEVHILGYGFKITDEFNEFVFKAGENRKKRIEAILSLLERHNINITLEELIPLAKGELSRLHIAQAMVKKGYEKDTKAGFDKWLSEGCSAYVSDFRPSPENVLSVIKRAGGHSVLAHPMRIKSSRLDILNIIDRLKSMGLDGVEANYKMSSQETKKYYKDAARSRGLFVTGGSDYHGTKGSLIPVSIEDSVLKILSNGEI